MSLQVLEEKMMANLATLNMGALYKTREDCSQKQLQNDKKHKNNISNDLSEEMWSFNELGIKITNAKKKNIFLQ